MLKSLPLSNEAAILPSADQWSFQSALDYLYGQCHTGPVLIHFKNGKPVVIELPNPIQIRLSA